MVAANAPVAAVFCKYPRKWWLIGRWDLATGRFEAGAWFHGTLYPRRSDISPNGELLAYFALKSSAGEFVGQTGVKTFTAVSKLPWLFALAAWGESGTWTRGHHFVEGQPSDIGSPDAGVAPAVFSRFQYGLVRTPVLQYSVEQRRGWIEHEDCPPRKPRDLWDETRNVILAKDRPRGRGRLILTGYPLAFNGTTIEGRRATFRFEDRRRTVDLPDAAWADWDGLGRLLVATKTGQLQIREGTLFETTVVCDLRGLHLRRRRAPDWARTWGQSG